MIRIARRAPFVAGLLFLGCAPPPTGPTPQGLGNVRAALEHGKNPGVGPRNITDRPMAFVVTAGTAGSAKAELIAFDLQGSRVLWRQPADVAGRVAVGRTVVIYSERTGALVARDVRSGAVSWRKPLQPAWQRVGYCADGDAVFETIQPAGGGATRAREGKVVGYDATSGGRRFATDLVGPLGAPAARGGVVAVLRQTQYVTLIDGNDGDVMASILSREQEASFVKSLPEGLFFGSKGVYLASNRTSLGEKKSGLYLEAKTPAFVRPLYHHDMYRPEQGDYSALDRNRLLWRVDASGDTAAFAGGQVVVHSFRFFFGVDAATGDLRWAYNHPRFDAMSSDLTGPAVVFVTADGQLGALDSRSGRRIYESSLGADVAVVGATFDADGFGTGVGQGEPLIKVLSSILWDPDLRFSDVRVFAVDELTRQPGRAATEELLKALDMGDGIPAPIMKKAMDALVSRQDRSMLDLYVKALQVHPDFAEDRRPKQLAFFARAVAQMKAKEAVPALVEHLRLPDTDPDVVREIAEAVIALGAESAVEAFMDFLLQYRADGEFNRATEALTAAADVLLKLGGPAERAALRFVAEEPQTIEVVASHIRRALAPGAD